MPPTLSSHSVATATANHRRAARSGWVIRVRCHCQPARLIHLNCCSIQARRPYQPASLASGGKSVRIRSEEHTSELQSLTNLVCRLLLEKKKTPISYEPR